MSAVSWLELVYEASQRVTGRPQAIKRAMKSMCGASGVSREIVDDEYDDRPRDDLLQHRSPPRNCRVTPAAASAQFVLLRRCVQHSSAHFCRPMSSYPRPPYDFSGVFLVRRAAYPHEQSARVHNAECTGDSEPAPTRDRRAGCPGSTVRFALPTVEQPDRGTRWRRF
jgi:hypothetical protein